MAVAGVARSIEQKGLNPAISCAMHGSPLNGAVSTGERNTSIFLERWSVTDEVSYADVLHCRTEVRYVGSVATRRVDEFDWSALQSCVVFDLSAFALDSLGPVATPKLPS